MLLKVNTSNTDYSGIHTIDAARAVMINAVGRERLDIVFDGGYGNQNPVFSFDIDENKADEVINCIGIYMDKHIKGRSPICTLYDEYSNYKCCPQLKGITVKTRKV